MRNAKNRVTQLARSVESGETIVVTRNGRRVFDLTFEIHQALSDDLNEGWIWLWAGELEHIQDSRPIIKISRRDGTKTRSVCCETLFVTSDYIKRWRERPGDPEDGPRTLRRSRSEKPTRDKNWPDTVQNVIFLSGWYRRRLGIEDAPCDGDLTIDLGNPVKQLWWQIRACLEHPQIAVVLSTALAVIGLGLAFIGVIQALKDLNLCSNVVAGWLSVAAFLLAVLAVPILLLYRSWR